MDKFLDVSKNISRRNTSIKRTYGASKYKSGNKSRESFSYAKENSEAAFDYLAYHQGILDSVKGHYESVRKARHSLKIFQKNVVNIASDLDKD